MKKLSDAQVHALSELSNHGKLDSFGAMLVLGSHYLRTMNVLEELNLVVYRPYGLGGKGAYSLTAEGRTMVTTLLKSGRIVPETK